MAGPKGLGPLPSLGPDRRQASEEDGKVRARTLHLEGSLEASLPLIPAEPRGPAQLQPRGPPPGRHLSTAGADQGAKAEQCTWKAPP